MYIPKFKKVYLPRLNLTRFHVEGQFFPELTPVFNRAWEETTKVVFSSSRDNFSRNHRGSFQLTPDRGYVYACIFLNNVLHSVIKGSVIYTLISQTIGNTVALEDAFQTNEADNAAINVDRIFLSDVEIALYRDIYANEDLNTYDFRRINAEACRNTIIALINCAYLASDTIAATIHNLIVYYLNILNITWLDRIVFDEQGVEFPNGINVFFDEFDPFEALLTEDFREFFEAYTLSHNTTKIISQIKEASILPIKHFTDLNGFRLTLDFFNSLTETIFSSALEMSVNYRKLIDLSRFFFEQSYRYSNYLRLKMYRSEWLPYDMKGSISFLIYMNHLEPVDTRESIAKEFIDHFESEFAEIIPLWNDFVGQFYIHYAELPANGNPPMRGYYTELNGANVIYSLELMSPYARNSYFLYRYRDGFEFSEENAVFPDTSSMRFEKTRYRDRSKPNFSAIALESDCPQYLEVLARCKQQIIISKADPMSTIYTLAWDDRLILLVPPINAVEEFKIGDGVINFVGGRAPDTFTTRHINVRDADYSQIIFSVKAGDYSIAHNSEDTNRSLKTLFNTIFLDAAKAKPFGKWIYVQRTELGRASVMALGSYFSMQSPSAAEQIIRYVSVQPVVNITDTTGTDFIVNRNLIVPFPFDDLYSSQAEIEHMRENHKLGIMPELIPGLGTDVLLTNGVQIVRDRRYSPFSDRLTLGLSRVRVGDHIAPPESFILRNTNQWGIRLYSLVEENKSKYIQNKSTVFSLPFDRNNLSTAARRDIDFYDPYPGESAYDAIFSIIVSIVADLSYAAMLVTPDPTIDGAAPNIELKARHHLQDVVAFIDRYLRHGGRIAENADYMFNATWGELRDALEASINSGDNTLLTVLTEQLLHIQNNEHVFWNRLGFAVKKRYFGCNYSLLEDKYFGVVRQAMPQILEADLRYVAVPHLSPGASAIALHSIIKNNFEILLNNHIGHRLYA